MKRTMKTMLRVLIIVALFVLSFSAQVQASSEIGLINQMHDYSFTKDSKWGKMPLSERLESCKIPSEKAERMTTEALLNSILDNPFMVHIIAFDTFEKGFRKICNNFPEVKSLISRNDLGSVILKSTKTIISSRGTSNREIVKKIYATVLFSQPEIVSKLSLRDAQYVNQILMQNNKSLTQALQEEATSRTSSVSYVLTPRGSRVDTYDQRSIPEFDSTTQSIIHNDMIFAHPSMTKVHEASPRYNCHSYAWYYTSAANTMWMPSPYFYRSDGSYYRVSGLVKVDDVIYWDNDSHSALVYYVGTTGINNLRAISKMGSAGVYIHWLSDCPYEGTTSFWRIL